MAQFLKLILLHHTKAYKKGVKKEKYQIIKKIIKRANKAEKHKQTHTLTHNTHKCIKISRL